MAWSDAVVTKSGLSLLADITANTGELNITDVLVGSGQISDKQSATSLVKQELKCEIIGVEHKNNTCQLRFRIRNKTVNKDFPMSEIGVFVESGGKRILFAVLTDDNPNTLPKYNGNYEHRQTMTIEFAYDIASSITLATTVVEGMEKDKVLKAIDEHNTNKDAHPDKVQKGSDEYLKALTPTASGFKAIKGDNESVEIALPFVKKTGDTMTGPLELKYSEGNKNQFKIGGRGGVNTISTGGTNSNDLDLGNKDFTARTKLVCKNRPEWNDNTRHPIAMLEDLNTKTTDHYRNRPEVRSLIDWERMKRENNGVDVRNIRVNNNIGSFTAYGGDSEVLARKYRSPGNGPILLNDDYNNYDELLVVLCEDNGNNVQFSSITVAHLNILMEQPYAFGLVSGLLWQIAPLKVANTGALNASTSSVLVNMWNNSGVIDIFGIRYKRYVE